MLTSNAVDGEIKLIDFGFAEILRPGQQFTTGAGTPMYVDDRNRVGIGVHLRETCVRVRTIVCVCGYICGQ